MTKNSTAILPGDIVPARETTTGPVGSFCPICTGENTWVYHGAAGCPYARKCIKCGRVVQSEYPQWEMVVMPFGSDHDGDIVCIDCLDKWLDATE